MIQKIIIGLFLSVIPFLVFGQNEKEELKKTELETSKEVANVINQLFDGMRLGDSSMVNSCFYHEVEMLTTYTDREGNAHLKKGSAKDFLKAVGTPHDEVWDEKLFDTEIRIDDNLAQVWAEYSFFLDDKFSHCGVNAFHLFKTKEGWKIFHLTDTRRRTRCNDEK